MSLDIIIVGALVAAALIILYALLAARAWQRDYQRAIEVERAVRHELERTR